ncbi:hypothetical protein PAMA_000787 [Pampus argenteus]
MEGGAEASPQQHPRRKPVLHGLEDQKRISLEPSVAATKVTRRGQTLNALQGREVVD